MADSDEILSSLIIILYMMLGLCMGSFASAISYRIQRGLSWVSVIDYKTKKKSPARSACPSCGHHLSFLDLIPLFSWLFFLGKCRYCHTKISFTYPVIEIAGALTILGYHFLGIKPILMAPLILLLPFLLSFILLALNRFRPPRYIFIAILLNVFVLVYSYSTI